MKLIRRIIFISALLVLFIPAVSALADDYYTFTYSTDPTSIPSVGGEVMLTVSISHDRNSAYSMTDAAVYKDDVKIIDIGNVYAGEDVTKAGQLSVDSSEIYGVNLTLRYSESGVTSVSKPFTVQFNTVENTQPKVEFTRTLSKLSGDKTDTVLATYTVKNVGDVHIENLVISDEAVGEIKTLPILKTGQNTVVEKNITIGDGFTSYPKIEYNVGSQGYVDTLTGQQVTSGSPELGIELIPNKESASDGEAVSIAIKVTNSGTADLENLIINESTIGELFAIDGLAAGDNITKTYEMTIESGKEYKFTAVGDNGGEVEWLAEKSLDMVIDIEASPLLITFDAAASTVVLDNPGIVSFDISINNESSDTYMHVVIVDNVGNEIETIESLLPGPTKFQYKMNIEESGSYFFTLSLTNSLGKPQSISTTPIDIVVNTNTEDNSSTNTQVNGHVDNQINDEDNELFGDLKKIVAIGLSIIAILLLILILRVIARNRRDY